MDFIFFSFYTMLYNTNTVTNQGLFMELRIKPKQLASKEIQQTQVHETTKAKSAPAKKDNPHKNHRLRLKGQFANNGIESLTDIQKLELLLFYALPQKDTNPISHALLQEFGSLTNVLTASLAELIKVKGVKENTAVLIKLFGSMLNYCSRPNEDDAITSSAKAKSYATRYFNHVSVEQFYVFCLTKTNKVKKAFLIGSGSTSEVNVEIRNITERALETNCNRIIIAHNHPFGKAVMSSQDCRFTYSLLCSCILNNIELLDHIIVGTDKTISLYEQGIIAKLKQKSSATIQISEVNKFFVSEEPDGYEKSRSEEADIILDD